MRDDKATGNVMTGSVTIGDFIERGSYERICDRSRACN